MLTPCACRCGMACDPMSMIVYHRETGERVHVVPEHLDAYHESEKRIDRPTGRQIVEKAGVRCVTGMANRYYWRSDTIMLTEKVACGNDPIAAVTALHETVHARHQPRWLVAAATMFWPIEWYCERDCWWRLFGAV